MKQFKAGSQARRPRAPSSPMWPAMELCVGRDAFWGF